MKKKESIIKIHYIRNDQNYGDWSLWIWTYPNGEGQEFFFDEIDQFGAVSKIPLSKVLNKDMTTLGFIVKTKCGWNKDIDLDRVIDLKTLAKDEEDYFNIYIQSGDVNIYEKPVYMTSWYRSESFSNLYNYDGPLGAIYSKKSTSFRVWSPISTQILLRIYSAGAPKSIDPKNGVDSYIKEYKMRKGKNGVFSVTINEDLEGKYYTYVVYNPFFKGEEIVDPYAVSTGINGLRGMIVDMGKTNPEGFEKLKIHPINRNNLTVYETHIADITSSKTWTKNQKFLKYAKTFKGACLSGTTYTENGITVKTGFDHIKELGVNAVQLLPIADQVNDERKMSFNWGYNPLNYNVLEGGYSTNPYDGYTRIKEFKELVKNYYDAGMNIIMDVVFNHVYFAPGSNFDVLMPGYYFRYKQDGTLSDGSSCGCETASEMPMMRKFIIDSVKFYAKEYKIGGFRFDLMGLHDLETMKKVAEAVKEVDPNIVIYGEPWAGGASSLDYARSAQQGNLEKYQGFGAFNDKIRDSLIKGGLSGSCSSGWVINTSFIDQNDINNIIDACKGAIKINCKSIIDSSKLVNYVSCHDNFTLFDRIKHNGISNNNIVKKMAMLANSVIFTTEGISFMLSGEEFMRTKKGNSNSYNLPYEINELDYSLKIKNLDMFNNYQKLIKFKQTINKENVNVDSSKGNTICLSFKDLNSGKTYKVIHANGFSKENFGSIDLEGYTLYLDTIKSNKKLSKSTKIESFETLIAYK